MKVTQLSFALIALFATNIIGALARRNDAQTTAVPSADDQDQSIVNIQNQDTTIDIINGQTVTADSASATQTAHANKHHNKRGIVCKIGGNPECLLDCLGRGHKSGICDDNDVCNCVD